MILLNKFVTFCGERLPARITYGAYEFKSYTRYDSFEVLYKKIRKTFVNHEDGHSRHLATFHTGEYRIYLSQTYFTINQRDFTEYYSVNLCGEVSDVRDNKFFREYTRALRHA